MIEKLSHPSNEKRWREEWDKLQAYKFNVDAKKPLYVIDTPPPFPTGEFHTGSTLNWGYIDFAARYKRMRGFEVLFPQGWDCHGFPTEVKVEAKHGKLPREEFRQKCIEFTQKNVASIKEQMQQMGFSIDWAHEYWTTDKEYHRKVQLSLVKMYEKGLVYRGAHPVLFCPTCSSAIAKAETEDVARDTTLNFVKFSCEEKDLIVATTRPELIHADAAIAFNPGDARYTHLLGKIAFSPVFNKPLRMISDPDVDPAFGTGLVMISTFGDAQDVVWTFRHKLPITAAFNERGLLMNANADYDGVHLTKARAKIIAELQEKGLITEQKPLKQNVKVHDRCKKPVEYMESAQWFIRVKDKKEEILAAARKMQWFPPHSLQLMVDWTQGLEWDWVISRQRVFGIPIPFWYCRDCGETFAPHAKDLPVDPSKDKPPIEKCRKCHSANIAGETSICDGWVDSSVTPLVISKWEENDAMFKKMYPVALRPQGTDIIRTWAFYSTYRCLMLTGLPPFKELLINGMVLGEDGKKMSKSLGNYVEAKEVIQKASVDALRQWIALSGNTGKDNVFYWKDIAYAQGFLTKLWNASKFVEKSIEGFDAESGSADYKKMSFRLADKWLLSQLSKTVKRVTESLDSYEYYSAITAIYNFFWKDFCDYYLEEVKYRIYNEDKFGKESKRAAQYVLREALHATLQLLAPFACYTTEELYHSMYAQEASRHKSIHLTSWPTPQEHPFGEQEQKLADALHSVLSQARKYKASNKLALNEPLASAEIHLPEQLMGNFDKIEDEIREVAQIKSVDLKRLPEGEAEIRAAFKP